MNKEIKIAELTWTIKEVPTTDSNLVLMGNKYFSTSMGSKQTIYVDESVAFDVRVNCLRYSLAQAFFYTYMLDYKESYSLDELCEFVAMYSKEINAIVDAFYEL